MPRSDAGASFATIQAMRQHQTKEKRRRELIRPAKTAEIIAEHEVHGEGPEHVGGDGVHHCEGGPRLQVVNQAKETPHQPR